MRWTKVEDGLPEMAKRVVVQTSTGHMTFGRPVTRLAGVVWIDDQSLPIRRVEQWFDPVAQDETP